MSRRISAFLVFGAALAVAIFLAFTNTALVQLSAFGAALSATAGACVIAGWVLGTIGSAALAAAWRQERKAQDATLTNWQTQDAKLAAQIQSDREKQLEAKVQTLETALSKALQRK